LYIDSIEDVMKLSSKHQMLRLRLGVKFMLRIIPRRGGRICRFLVWKLLPCSILSYLDEDHQVLSRQRIKWEFARMKCKPLTLAKNSIGMGSKTEKNSAIFNPVKTHKRHFSIVTGFDLILFIARSRIFLWQYWGPFHIRIAHLQIERSLLEKTNHSCTYFRNHFPFSTSLPTLALKEKT